MRYWDGNGKFQKEYEAVKHIVPSQGQANSAHGELLRCAGNLYYEAHNNGFINQERVRECLEGIRGASEELENVSRREGVEDFRNLTWKYRDRASLEKILDIAILYAYESEESFHIYTEDYRR